MIKRIAILLAMVVASFGVAASPALADDPGELGSCTHYVSTGIGSSYGGGEYTGSGDWYAYSPLWVVQSNSACEDLQLTNLYSMSPSMKFRVRFYPSSGGNYANSWKYVQWGGNFVIATDIANGTWLRVEGVEQVSNCPSCQQTVLAENFDVKF